MLIPFQTRRQDFYRSTLPAVSQLLELRISLLQAGHSCVPSPSFVTFTKHIIAYGELSRSLVNDKISAFGAMGVTEQVRDVYIQVVRGAASDVVGNIKGEQLVPFRHNAARPLMTITILPARR